MSRRTAYSNTYDNHDGTYTTQISTAPVNYLPSGSKKYQPVDTTLSDVSGGNGRVRASRMQTPVEVGAADDPSGFLSVDTGSGVIRMSLAPGVNPGKRGQKPSRKASEADLGGLMSNIDLQAVVDSTGVRIFFVLDSRPSSSSFSVAIDGGGLTPTLENDGSISFLDKKGNLAASMPIPYAEDSNIDPHIGSGKTTYAVNYTLAPSGKQWLLTVSVDAGFLQNAKYPVYVDPSVIGTSQVYNNTVNNQSALINKNLPDMYSQTGIHEFLVGYDSISQWASYLKFDLAAAGINGYVTSATMDLYPYHQWYGTSSCERTRIKLVTSSWSPSSITWNNAPYHAAPNPSEDSEYVGCQGTWSQNASWAYGNPFTGWARSWEQSPTTNFGVYLYGDAGTTTYWKRFTSSQSSSNQPYLNVTYVLPSVSASNPIGNTWTNNPAVSWTYSNPNGPAQAGAWVQVATDAGLSNLVVNNTWVAGSGTSYSIPVGLTNGQTYYWRVAASDGYGWSAWSSINSFRWDTSVPTWNGFTAPGSATVYQSATTYRFSWNAASDLSGIGWYGPIIQYGSVVTPGSCTGVAWTNSTEVGTGNTYIDLTGAQNNTCYRVAVEMVDGVGNRLSYQYSNAVLVDTATPAAPAVTDNCAAIGSCYRVGNTIYFQPIAAKTIALTSTGVDTPSGIASSNLGPLSDFTGWTYTPGVVTGNPATKSLTWSAASTKTVTLQITTANRAGTNSSATTITLVPDTGAMAAFSSPAAVGAPTTALTPGSSFTVSWTETTGLSSIAGRSLQLYTIAGNADGTCPAGGTWTAQGSPSTATGSVTYSASSFIAGNCYRWIQTLTDSLGPLPFTSASIYVDATAPTAVIATPSANQPIAGSLSISGTATDTYLASYTLAYGVGTSPTSWTTISTSTTPVAGTGPLGTWTPGSLTGVYSLRLSAVDTAGNSSVKTVVVYLDNSARGSEAAATSVPFDLDGGWKLDANVATGEASLTRNLFDVPSNGPAASLAVTYNSGDPSPAGQLGVGWSSNLTQYLSFESGFIVWHEADGARVPFGQVAGTWTTLPGRHETLGSGTGSCGSSGSTCIVHQKDQTTLTFEGSGSGRLLAATDRFGKALTLSWGSSSATTTDATGRTTTISLDATNGRISSIVDSAGRTWSFGYSGTGSSSQLTSIGDPAGNATNFAYSAGLLTSIIRTRTSVGPVAWSIGYTSGKATSVVDPIGGAAHPSIFSYGSGTTSVTIPGDPSSTPSAPATTTTTYVYEAHGWVTQTTDAAGYVTNTSYYPTGDVQSSSREVNQPATRWATTSYEYDAAGNLSKETDPIGTIAKYTYNSTNDQLSRKQAFGTPIEIDTQDVHNATGHLCREVQEPTIDVTTLTHPCTDALPASNADQNIDTRYSYDANNELASETDALGVVTTYGYDTFGDRTSETRNYISGHAPDASTNVTTSYAYDQATVGGKLGLRTSETNPVGVTTSYAYDVMGNQLSASLPGDSWVPSERTVSTFDEFGAKTSTNVYLGGSQTSIDTTSSTYNARGWVVATSDASATATTTTATSYDLAGDATSVTGTDGKVTAKTYDALRHPATETPPGANPTTRTYDGLVDETSTSVPATTTTYAVTNRSFDLDGHLLTETADATGTPATTTHVPDALGRDIQVTDPVGLVTTTTYDGVGRVTRTMAGTSITDRTYDKPGNELTVTAPYASGATPAVTKSIHDELNRQTSSIENYVAGSNDPAANLTTTTYYDAAEETVASVDPKGIVARSIYDIDGHVAESIANCTDSGTTPSANPAACSGAGTHDKITNIVTTNSYSVDGTKVSSTTTAGTMVTAANFDGAGRTVSSIVDPGSSPHLALETDYAYDAQGRQIAVKSPTGPVNNRSWTVTVTVYDVNGRVGTTITNCTDDPAGSAPGANWAGCSGSNGLHDATWNLTTSYLYDSAGHKSRETAPNGSVTLYAYDTAGRLSSQINDYVAGQPTDAAGGVNATTNFYYDADGRRIGTASPSPTTPGTYVVTFDTYDIAGHLSSEIVNCTSSGTTPDANPAACTAQGTHDATTNVTTSYTYDAAGNKTSMTAPSPANGAGGTATVTTNYAYNANDRLCRVLENASLSLASLTNPCTDTVTGTTTTNVSTRYDYTSTGLLADQYSSINGTTTYGYDPAGHKTSELDPDNKTTYFSYGVNGNKITETDPDSPNPTLSWAYDTAGRMCRRLAANPGVDLSTLANPCADAVSGATVDTRYAFDTAGNQSGATDALSGQAISVTLDQQARPTSVSDTGGSISDPGTTYGYSFTSPTRTDPSGSYTFAIDAYGRQTAVTDPLSHPDGHGFDWAYGPSGLLASQTDPTGSADTTTSDNAATYSYDALGRLTAKSTSAMVSGVNTPRANFSFTYNSASNLVGQTVAIARSAANGSTSYTYDALGRIVGYTPPAGIAPETYAWNASADRTSITTGSTSISTIFDAASRRTSDSAGNSYAYDGQGRLTLMAGQNMTYDALGRLVAVHQNGTGTLLASYTYDPLDRLETVTEAGATTSFLYVGLTNAVARTSTTTAGNPTVIARATDLSGTEVYEFDASTQATIYLGRNAHGDVSWTTDTTGAVTASATYDPFGNLVNSSGPVPSNRWQSSWQDTTTGLYYVVARWYAPSMGAFLSEDPLGHGLSRPEDNAPYAYGAGDPTNKVDPDGQSSIWPKPWSMLFTAIWALQNGPIHNYNGMPSNVACTDFASRALRDGGGYRMVIPSDDAKWINDGSYWTNKNHKSQVDHDMYYGNLWFDLKHAGKDIHTTSWAKAPYLMNFLTSREGGFRVVAHWFVKSYRGPNERGAAYAGPPPAGIKIGDIAFANWHDPAGYEQGITHALVVVGVSTWDLTFAQHSPDLNNRHLVDMIAGPYWHPNPELWIVEPK